MKKIITISLILILTQFSFASNQKKENMFGIFKKQEPIDKFWSWFQKNEKRLRNIENKQSEILGEILEKAREIESGLAFDIEPIQNGILTLTISADGVKDLFPVVQEIVKKSPKINGWNFIAFRQKIDKEKVKGMILKSGNHELDPNKMKFFPIVDGKNLDIIIYVEGVNDENYNGVTYGGLILMDNLIGEYDCVTKVRNYDFHDMPKSKEELAELKPLLEISDYIEKFYNEKK
ncbi:hypothetical protein [Flavobacterium psychrophilum]|nr:hypothetical protein [Flavobacterium psychrophilum]MCB6099655.1 hypothetical protein [Flavobacterium psychrophilum]